MSKRKCLFEFPGGGLEFGETLEEAVKREILEECGIDVLVKNQMTTFNHILPKEGQHWISVVYICYYQSGELTIKETDKCSGLVWLNFDEIDLDCLTSVSKDCWNYLNENWYYDYDEKDLILIVYGQGKIDSIKKMLEENVSIENFQIPFDELEQEEQEEYFRHVFEEFDNVVYEKFDDYEYDFTGRTKYKTEEIDINSSIIYNLAVKLYNQKFL